MFPESCTSSQNLLGFFQGTLGSSSSPSVFLSSVLFSGGLSSFSPSQGTTFLEHMLVFVFFFSPFGRSVGKRHGCFPVEMHSCPFHPGKISLVPHAPAWLFPLPETCYCPLRQKQTAQPLELQRVSHNTLWLAGAPGPLKSRPCYFLDQQHQHQSPGSW